MSELSLVFFKHGTAGPLFRLVPFGVSLLLLSVVFFFFLIMDVRALGHAATMTKSRRFCSDPSSSKKKRMDEEEKRMVLRSRPSCSEALVVSSGRNT